MNSDQTQPQNPRDQRHSQHLSLSTSSLPTIDGYQILRLLGQGAFGQVWLAYDLNTRRPVAIKQFLHRGGLDMESLGREISLLAKMSAGRNIVQVLKVGWDQIPPYYVMEYMENGSLDDLMNSDKPISVPQCVHLFREIAEGLSFAHGKGILHCDLKPANVLLDHSFHPRLADFGQGRVAGEHTSSLGTLFYMSPEQADLQATPDVTWDVYSLGAIAYALLTGSPPYRTAEVVESLKNAKTVSAQLNQYRHILLHSARPKLHRQPRKADKELQQIIDRCLHPAPQQRYQNVQQVLGALEQRNRVRSRRPLYLLGLVGPMLLMLLMLLFSARSRSLALEQSEQSVVKRALESNRFAARYAARTLETELLALFQIVESEAQREELQQLLQATAESGANDLTQLAEGRTSPALRERIVGLPERIELESYLNQRIAALAQKYGRSAALLNSLFVNDSGGTNLAIAFADELGQQSASSPVGLNFAYRSYFTGQRVDGLPTEPASSFQPTRSTRLSASFRSTSTGAWKIAISAPIWTLLAESGNQGDSESDNRKPLGVCVLTINLGDFELLAERGQRDSPLVRFAALFDGRKGNQRGTLLQHPFISGVDREKLQLMKIPQIPVPLLEELAAGDTDNYQDPAAELEGGQQFAGRWIASIAQVELPTASHEDVEQSDKSDLWILVQERQSSVSAPIESLASNLAKEKLLEVLTLVTVILVLWYFVFRLGQFAISVDRSEKSANGSESTVKHSGSTRI